MKFRERPEYAQWRVAVCELFGKTCIVCGHPRNIHVHHVRPVEAFPELALDPRNGVPLCGNCHSAIRGVELDHIDKFERLQRVALGRNVDNRASIEVNETRLKQVDETTQDYLLSPTEREIQQLDAAIAAAEKASDEEGIFSGLVRKANCLLGLKRDVEAIDMLRQALTSHPENGRLHHFFAQLLYRYFTKPSQEQQFDYFSPHVVEMRNHAKSGVFLSPSFAGAKLASDILLLTDSPQFASGENLRLAGIMLEYAETDSQRVEALCRIGAEYKSHGAFDDAIEYYKKAAAIKITTGTHAQLAECLYSTNRFDEARQWAKWGLSFDANDEACANILKVTSAN